MKRLVRILRTIAGLVALGFAFGWALEAFLEWRRRPRYGFDEGRPTGLRVAPLSALEAAEARAVERDFYRDATDWAAANRPA